MGFRVQGWDLGLRVWASLEFRVFEFEAQGLEMEGRG